ncbi:MAG TPA: hypothetical protein PLZ95_07725 [Bryobacteraceae bacterium]|nr:hypothetical protein [Bryobacteraceae bacterium]
MNDNVTNKLTPQQAFEEQIKERLRQNIGELLPDEVLSEMVKKALTDMFFTPRIQRDRWGGQVENPSWFEEEAGKLLRDRISEYLKTWLKENGPDLTRQVQEQISKNATSVIAAFFVSVLQGQAHMMAMNIQNVVNQALEVRFQR